MTFDLGTSYTFQLRNNLTLDISVYQHYWFTIINMSIWEKGNGIAKEAIYKKHFNYENVLPRSLAIKLTRWSINKQSQKIAGINLV